MGIRVIVDDGTPSEGSWRRSDRLEIEGPLVLEFDLGGEGQEDRILIGGYDLHDLLASQFSVDGGRVQKLGLFRVVVERA